MTLDEIRYLIESFGEALRENASGGGHGHQEAGIHARRVVQQIETFMIQTIFDRR